MKRLTYKQQFTVGSVGCALALGSLFAIGVNAEKNENRANSKPTESVSPSETPSESESASPKPKKPSVKPSPVATEQYDGDNVPYSLPPEVKTLTPAPRDSLVELVDKLKYNDENNDGYDRSKFGSRAPTAATREALIEEEMRPNNTWYSWWDGFVYEGADGLDADHTVALAEAWGSGARNWTEEKRIDFANDLSSPYTLNLITDTLNKAKSDSDPFDWMPAVNRCEYVKQWTSVKLRWGLTADAEEKMALHFRAEECDKEWM